MIDQQTIRSALDELDYTHSEDREGDIVVPILAFGTVVLGLLSIECDGRFLEIRSIGLPGREDCRPGSRTARAVASGINRRYRAAKAMIDPTDGELVICIDQWFRDSNATTDEVAFLFKLFVKVVREALGAIIAKSSPLPTL